MVENIDIQVKKFEGNIAGANPKLREALRSIARSSQVIDKTDLPKTPGDSAKLSKMGRDRETLEGLVAKGVLSGDVLERLDRLTITGPSVQEVYQGTKSLFFESALGAETDPISDLAWFTDSNGSEEKWRFGGDVPQMKKLRGGEREFATLSNAEFAIKNEEFGTGITMLEKDVEDDRLGMYVPQIAQLGQNAAVWPSEYIAKHLLNGFAGNLFPDDYLGAGTCYTGSQFFSNSHVMESGVSGLDNLVGALALTEANLKIADLQLKSMRTWSGQRSLRMRGTHLIVGPKQEEAAVNLIKALWIINASGNANRDNVYWKGRYTVVVSDLIEIGTPQENWWFLADMSKPAFRPMIFQNRRKMRTLTPNGPDSEPLLQRGQLRYAIDARAGIGFFEPRCIVGANPAQG